MDTLQKTFEAALDKHIEEIKANLIRKKFQDYGITLTDNQVSAIAGHADGDYTLDLDDTQLEPALIATGSRIPDKITIDYSDDDIQAVTSQFSSILSEVIPTVVDKSANLILQELQKTSASELSAIRKDRERFEARLSKRWNKPFQLLDTYLAIVHRVGAEFNQQYRPIAAKENDLVFDVLVRLHGRACQVGSEVMTLLRAGFADGAHARWRSLHEIASVALFISKHGRDAAERYILHDLVESYKGARQYQDYCKALGDKPLSKRRLEQLRRNYELAVNKFGASFGKDYGWASAAISNVNPRFSDIERDVGLEKFRPYYKMASQNVHANPKGITFKLGLPKNSNALLAGPSEVGLADPGHGTAISLLQITVTLLALRPNIDHLATSAVLTKLQRRIGEEFLRAHKRL